MSVRELWLGQQSRFPLAARRRTTLVAPVPNPSIRFWRGASFFQPGVGAGTIETPVIAAVDKKVLGWMAKHGDTPESAVVLAVRVPDPTVTDSALQVETPKGSKSYVMNRATGGWECPQRFVLMYGDDGDLKGAKFDGIELLDVSKSGDVPFAQTVKFKVQGHERELGVIDFLIKDADGKFGTARFGIFKGRKPIFKLVAPKIGPNFLKLILDDGDEETDDELDVSKLIDPTGPLTEKSDFVDAVAHDSPKVVAATSAPGSARSRIFHEPPEGGDLATFLFGENRIRIEDSRNGQTLFIAHFLIYAKPDETVPAGGALGEDEAEVDGVPLRVAKNALALNFDSGTADAAMAGYLYSLRLRPRGTHRDSGYVQASPGTAMAAAELGRVIERVRGFHDSLLVAIGFEPLLTTGAESPGTALETLPAAFREVTTPEFNIGTGGFANVEPHYFHHFYIHTFAAHRLVEKIRFSDLDPPTFTLTGGNFDLDKTFVLPTGRDEIRRMIQARHDHADRKLAVFGHTDATGSDTYNNELSARRARTTFALLTKDVDEWMRRLDSSAVSNERPWGVREVQHMLTVTGFYHGPINGLRDTATRQAIRDFQTAKSPPATGNDDTATRRALVDAYMDEMTGGPLAAADFFADAGGNPAVFGCGEAFLLVTTDRANAANRRVVLILRHTPIEPLDPTQRGPAVPFPDWLAQEAADAAADPDFVVGCTDSGFALNDDFRGDHANEPNRWFVKGRRLPRPTDINAAAAVNTVVFEDGDLRSITDSTTVLHGSSVMTSMASDGVGDDIAGTARNAAQVVLGTGKHIRLRVLRSAFDTASAFRKYEVMGADPEIKVISSSLLFQDATTLSAANQATLRTKIKNCLDAGKILFIAAHNVDPGNFPNKRDAARTEGGLFVPQRSQTRASFTGANAFQAKIAVVGATNHVTTTGDPEVPSFFSYLGTEVSLAFPGTDIRVMSSGVPPTGGPLGANHTLLQGIRIRPINGTSFSTPMTAGVAGELLLVNDSLKQAANIGKVIELLEATADDVASLGAIPLAQQGQFVPGSAGADPQLVAADLAGFRRVNFWKAILAAANDGIPTESKLSSGAAATTLFTQLTAKDHAATTWYGFEIRIQTLGANVWLRKADGTQVRFEDTGASLPDGRTTASAWRQTQPLRAPATHANAGFRGFVLPARPVASGLFMGQLSIKREELAKFAELRLYLPDVDPVAPAAGNLPPLVALALDKIVRMRDPKAITAAERTGDATLDQIATHVEEFDDFVFHVTVVPQAVAAFQFVHPAAVAVGETVNVRVFAVDKFGNMKPDFNGPVNVFHTGTAGAAGATPSGVFFNAAPATAAVAVNLVNGAGALTLTANTAETFRLTASDGAGHSERGATDIQAAPPGPIGSFRVDVARADGADPGTHPPQVNDQLTFTVTALDADGRTKTDYTGTVELKVAEGTEGYDGAATDHPPKGGVQVADAIMDPFDAARLKHTYTAADAGVFAFPVFNYTAGPLVIEARDGNASGQSRRVETLGGALDHFTLVFPASGTQGTAMNLTVTCKDGFENTITQFEDRVKVSAAQGTAGAVNAGQKVGVHIGDTSAATDDFHEFEPRDRGVFTFRVTPYTAENIQMRVQTDGGVQNDTAVVAIAGPGALASFGLEVFASQMNGVRFLVKVRALDARGQLIPTFTGTVNAALVTGTAFAAAGPTGVQIHTASHTYAAGDSGEFPFDFTGFTIETISLRFTSGGVSATTPNIQIQ